jgi:hypothetical protein
MDGTEVLLESTSERVVGRDLELRRISGGRPGIGSPLRWARGPVSPRSVLLLGASLAMGGCGAVLEPDPSLEVLPGIIDGSAQAALMVADARSDFACAYSNFVYNTAHLSGELMGSSAAVLDRPLATRTVLPITRGTARGGCEVEVGLFVPLSQAVASSEAALRTLVEATDAGLEGRRGLMGEAALLAGFSYTAFGEAFCEASFNGGPPLSPMELFALAEDRFTIAATMAELAGDLDTFLAALVGRARVRLPQGKRAEAVGDARRVPRDFRYEVERSNDSPGERNDVYVANAEMGTASVDPHYWDLQWMGVPDPRISLRDVGAKGTNGVTPLVVQQKYTWGGFRHPVGELGGGAAHHRRGGRGS